MSYNKKDFTWRKSKTGLIAVFYKGNIAIFGKPRAGQSDENKAKELINDIIYE